jgi:acyl-CoA thioesterase
MSQEHPILAGDHASRWMGITVDRAEYGHAQIRMTLREEMLNGFGIAHGGMVFALADTCFALACNDPDGDGSTITVASGADINFLASPRRGQELTAVGTVRARTGRSGVYDIQVTAGDRLVAEFRGRSRTIPNPALRAAAAPAAEPAAQTARQATQQTEDA